MPNHHSTSSAPGRHPGRRPHHRALRRSATAAVALLLLLLASSASAQIRMVSIDPATDEVVLRNFGAGNVDVATWWLCRAPGTYRQISGLSVSGPTLLGPGDEVTVVYTGQLGEPGQGVGLYETPSFGSASAIRDYMQYLTQSGVREPIAVAAGIWPDDDEVTGAAPYTYVGDGTQNGAAFWTGAAAPVPSVSPAALFALSALMPLCARRALRG